MWTKHFLNAYAMLFSITDCYCPTVSVDVLLQLSYFLLGGWWQDLHSGPRKTLHSAKHENAKKSENPLSGSTSCAASLRRAVHRMTGLGQNLWDSHSLMTGGKPQGNLLGSDCGSVCQGGAEVSSTRRRCPWVNLRWALQVGAWNVLSQREDDHLSVIICAQAFGHRYCSSLWGSETGLRRDHGGGYTYY